ncbi:ABC transporter permease [Weissella viridescens]|uniref:Transport permease protein n=1 Tax=Weissella viridescens TaxID=1629 RepID=A0A3P2RD98_WEIVI|nr:ABC transporter permease [Weissella viridescens]RRG18574.1 ABC transporter permease [Weissella viridescens]
MEMRTHQSHLIMNTGTMAYRNLLKTMHNPDKVLDVVVQPILFMLMFSFLFGSAIAGNVHAYLPIIVPGILMQSLLSAASGSGSQINEDLHSGIYDRFKSLPIAHIAPLAGQLFADILRLFIAAVASLGTGFLLGWRPAGGFGWVVAVVLLDVFLGWAMSWIFAFYGILAKSATMVESVSLMTMLVLSFLSTAFVPMNQLPQAMQVIVHLNPVTYVIQASRMMLNHGVWTNQAWIVLGAGIVVVFIFAPLTVWAYNRKS